MKTFLLIACLLLVAPRANAQATEQVAAVEAPGRLKKLQALQARFQREEKARQERVARLARQHNWPLYKSNSKGGFDQLMDVLEDKIPLYYSSCNVIASQATRTNHLNTGGSLGLTLDGQGMTAYVWDGGPVRTTHQELVGRITIGDGAVALNANSTHATHIAGTIGAAGINASAKGMASQCNVITYDWTNQLPEATGVAIAAPANQYIISNHPYAEGEGLGAGISDWLFGAYMYLSHDWDELMSLHPYYLMVKPAGNLGNDDASNMFPIQNVLGYDKLMGSETCKNNLVVANALDPTVTPDGTLVPPVFINSASSEGPTDDLRIKPDITGNGTTVLSCSSIGDNQYTSLSGTSMASANVTGTLLLLQQHYHNLNGNFMRAATLKGLALHTADDIGAAGPDAVSGWGLLNAKRAAETISQNGETVLIQELTLNQGETYVLDMSSDNINALAVSISWTDPAGTITPPNTYNSTTPVLVNDLDLRVTQGGATHFPHKLTSVTTNGTGDNNVDPYERINVAGASGSYTLTVSHKGILTGGLQAFSLIITGITVCPPNVVITGNYSKSLTESQTWITSSGQTTIDNAANVQLDADPVNGYIEFYPTLAANFFHSQPTGNALFRAELIDGCGALAMARMGPSFTNTKKSKNQAGEPVAEESTEDPEILPGGFALYQNTPNPFTKNTTLTAVVPETVKQAKIVVYTLQGAELEHYPLAARGKVSVEISGSRFSSGVYLYALVADGQVIATKKMILTK